MCLYVLQIYHCFFNLLPYLDIFPTSQRFLQLLQVTFACTYNISKLIRPFFKRKTLFGLSAVHLICCKILKLLQQVTKV